jgi:transcriptional regulator with XRE-family HTH domain
VQKEEIDRIYKYLEDLGYHDLRPSGKNIIREHVEETITYTQPFPTVTIEDLSEEEKKLLTKEYFKNLKLEDLGKEELLLLIPRELSSDKKTTLAEIKESDLLSALYGYNLPKEKIEELKYDLRKSYGYNDKSFTELLKIARLQSGKNKSSISGTNKVDMGTLLKREKGQIPKSLEGLNSQLESFETNPILADIIINEFKILKGYEFASLENLSAAQILKNARIDKDFSQEYVSEKLNFPSNYVTFYEEDRVPDKYDIPRKIMAFYDIEESAFNRAIDYYKERNGFDNSKLEELSLRQILKNLRLDNELTAAEVKKGTGIDVNLLEAGKGPEHLDTLKKILNYYNASDKIFKEAVNKWDIKKKESQGYNFEEISTLSFGQIFKNSRIEKGLKPNKVMEELGVPESTFYALENKSVASDETIKLFLEKNLYDLSAEQVSLILLDVRKRKPSTKIDSIFTLDISPSKELE